MAQQLQIIDLNSSGALALPAHLQNLPTIVGTIAQGDTRNRIGLKGREFHIFRGGIEEGVLETKHADIIMVGAYPAISRMYFDKPYEDGVAMAPACYSANGITPEENAASPQSDKCQTCPQNVKGSSLAGSEKSKACGFFRRIAVVLYGDPEYTVYQLDLKAMSIWDDDREGRGHNGKFSFTNYAKKLSAHHIDPGKVVTRLTFTADSVPALQFQAVGYITAEQAAHIVELVETGAVKPALELNLGGNASDVVPPPAQIAPPQPAAPAPRTAAPARPAPTVAPPAPKPVAARPAQPVAARPAPRVAVPVQVAMPPEEEEPTAEDVAAAAHPAMQPVKIQYAQRNKPTQPLNTRPAPPKATVEGVQQDVDALIAELDG